MACLRDLRFLYSEHDIFKMIVQLCLHLDFTICKLYYFLQIKLTVYFQCLKAEGVLNETAVPPLTKALEVTL